MKKNINKNNKGKKKDKNIRRIRLKPITSYKKRLGAATLATALALTGATLYGHNNSEKNDDSYS